MFSSDPCLPLSASPIKSSPSRLIVRGQVKASWAWRASTVTSFQLLPGARYEEEGPLIPHEEI